MPSKYEKVPKRKLTRLISSFLNSSGTSLTKEDFLARFLKDREYLCHFDFWVSSGCNSDYSPALKVLDVAGDLNNIDNFSITFSYLIPNQSQQLKERYLKDKYGVTNVSKLKEVVDKRKQTCINKYGTVNIFADEGVKGKSITTCLRKYGVEHHSQAEEIKKKTKQTFLGRYGVDHNFKVPSIRKNIEETNLKKYGFPNHTQSPENKTKRRKTCIERGHWQELPTGETPREFHRRTDYSYKTCLDLINKLGFEEAEQFLKDSTRTLTSLEKEVSLITKLVPTPRTVLTNKRKPDFKLNGTTYLDVDGLYFHSDAVQKNPNYHLEKRQSYENLGLRLIQLREDEIKYRPEVVKSLLNNAMDKDVTKVYARKCVIEFVPPKVSRAFVEENHLQGFGRHPVVHLGLTYKGGLVQVLTLSPGFNPGEIFIERFCTKLGLRVPGGFSKLLKRVVEYCKENKYKKLLTFCDLRYATGASYEKAGFIKTSEKVSWKWTDCDKTYHRLTFHKNSEGYERGFFKIYDAGQRKYELEL